MSNIMKGISCCADCANYSMKKHRCMIAKDEGRASDHFYADCPPIPEALVRANMPELCEVAS